MNILYGIALMALGPIFVGLLLGIDRRITARMQNRVGPPLLQPFYDLAKLFRKDRLSNNRTQISFAVAALLLQAAAWCIFSLGGDMLVAFFVSGAGSLALALGAFSVRSAYSQVGAQRELLQMLAYEPVLLLALIVLAWQNHSFLAAQQDHGLVLLLPLVLLAFIPVLAIKMQKSPFDLATAHQEIVSGVYVEYAGPYYGLLKLANFFELALVFGFVSLFFWDANIIISIIGKALLVLVFLFIVVLMDNSTARVTRGTMVRYTWALGLGLIAVNILIVFLADVIA